MRISIRTVLREALAILLWAFVLGVIILLTTYPGNLFGQVPERGDYSVYYEATSATSHKVTIQVPTGGRVATITALQVQCISTTSTDVCDVEFQRGGTDATATALTANKPNDKSRAPTTLAFRSSDAGAGTTYQKVQQPNGAPIAYKPGFVLVGAGAKVTIIVTSTNAMTYRIYGEWDE